MDPTTEFFRALITSGTDQAVGVIAALGKKVAPLLRSQLSPKGKKQFDINLTNFGSRLSAEVRQRIDSGQLSQEQVARVLDQPDVVNLLINALAQAAQSENTDKQVLLAKVISERLGAEADSELALVSPMACEAISRLSARHLKLLALRYIFVSQRYNEAPDSEGDDEAVRRLREVEWLICTFEPYQDLVAGARDAEHLVAVGCAGGLQGFLADELKSTLERMVSPDLDLETFKKTTTWQHLETVWNDARLAGMALTSVGSLIGMYTSDILANRQTDMDKWLNRS